MIRRVAQVCDDGLSGSTFTPKSPQRLTALPAIVAARAVAVILHHLLSLFLGFVLCRLLLFGHPILEPAEAEEPAEPCKGCRKSQQSLQRLQRLQKEPCKGCRKSQQSSAERACKGCRKSPAKTTKAEEPAKPASCCDTLKSQQSPAKAEEWLLADKPPCRC